MGFFFPLGLTGLASEQVPWAWAANGCASVLGTILAVSAAANWGFGAVLGAAALLYVIAAAVVGRGFN